MQEIKVNEAVTVVFDYQDSNSGDSVTYKIYNSDGSSFATGSATYIAGFQWKVMFTPANSGVYIVEVYHATFDVTKSQSFNAKSTISQSSTLSEKDEPTTAEMLVNVNKAIDAIMTGGAVQAYTIQGRNLQRCSLDQLMNLRKRLQNEISVSRGSATNYAAFDR